MKKMNYLRLFAVVGLLWVLASVTLACEKEHIEIEYACSGTEPCDGHPYAGINNTTDVEDTTTSVTTTATETIAITSISIVEKTSTTGKSTNNYIEFTLGELGSFTADQVNEAVSFNDAGTVAAMEKIYRVYTNEEETEFFNLNVSIVADVSTENPTITGLNITFIEDYQNFTRLHRTDPPYVAETSLSSSNILTISYEFDSWMRAETTGNGFGANIPDGNIDVFFRMQWDVDVNDQPGN